MPPARGRRPLPARRRPSGRAPASRPAGTRSSRASAPTLRATPAALVAVPEVTHLSVEPYVDGRAARAALVPRHQRVGRRIALRRVQLIMD
eukprot:scaffold1557_cov108-Isochrysis_galbana.AAC.4